VRLDEAGDVVAVESDGPIDFDEADLAVGDEFLKSTLRNTELSGGGDGLEELGAFCGTGARRFYIFGIYLHHLAPCVKNRGHMTLISTAQLAVIAGLKTRQIQRLLDKGVPGLGATKSEGGHWLIPDTAAVRKWAKNHRRWKRPTVKPGINPADKSRGIVTIEGIAQQFIMWHRKMVAEIETWDESRLDRAIQLLEPQAQVHAELVALRQALK
jgi:hypothetical protein